MDIKLKTSMRREVLGVVALFCLVLTSLYLMGRTLEEPTASANIFIWILVVNVIALLGFVSLVGRRAWILWRSLRSGEDGARLTRRLVFALSGLAVIPVLIIFIFSIRFIQSGINRWYDVNIEKALQSALALSQQSAGSQLSLMSKLSENIAQGLSLWEDDSFNQNIDAAMLESGALELSVLSDRGEIIFTSGGVDLSVLSPNLPSKNIIETAINEGSTAYLDSLSGRGLVARTITMVASIDPSLPQRLLVVLYPIDSATNELAVEVDEVYSRYRQLVYLRTPLQLSFVMTLSVAMALSLLLAVWLSFIVARWLMLPIRQLSAGTLAVAEGDYSRRLSHRGADELDFLVRSFNRMTSKLQQMQSQNERQQAALETERSYLEAVFGQLSSGIIVLEPSGQVRTANAAAAALLDVELSVLVQRSFGSIHGDEQPQFEIHLAEALGANRHFELDWEMSSEGKNRQLVCKGRPLLDGERRSWVLVLDDISAIVRSQRDAAWSEAARRLAHEIKNPLTPIQLYAERLESKLAPQLDPAGQALLSKASQTIIAQVDSLKLMVNAFAQYAASPNLEMIAIDLKALLESVVTLYEGLKYNQVVLYADCSVVIRGDKIRLRQLAINLIKNALEAIQKDQNGCVQIRLYRRADTAHLDVEDNGPGFDPHLLDRIYEPYVTSKAKGTGIGLAVVNKIIDEHGGAIDLGASPSGGAKVALKFDVFTQS